MAALAAQRVPEDVVARIDQRVVLHGVPWAQYEALAAGRGESAVPRLTYLGGTLEIMSPSHDHEKIKTNIARLLKAWADAKGVELEGYGSWTVRREELGRGLEPDECYVLGAHGVPTRPDLAIEVNWTRGGIDKLDVYRGLEVPEVWVWEDDRIVVYVLTGGRYVVQARSALLPELDLALIAELLPLRQSEAVRVLRARI